MRDSIRPITFDKGSLGWRLTYGCNVDTIAAAAVIAAGAPLTGFFEKSKPLRGSIQRGDSDIFPFVPVSSQADRVLAVSTCDAYPGDCVHLRTK